MKPLLFVSLLLTALGCKGDEAPEPDTKTTVPTSEATVAVSSKRADEASVKPSAAPHPDLVAVCDASKKQLAAGGLDVYLSIFLSDIPVSDSEIKKGLGAIGNGAPNMFKDLMLEVARQAGHPDWDCPELWELAKTSP